MAIRKLHPTLDVPGFYPFDLVETNSGWAVTINLKYTTQNSNFISHLFNGLRLDVGDKKAITPSGTSRGSEVKHQIQFDLPTPLPEKLTFSMNGQPVSELKINDGYLHPGEHHALYQLAISETRALGMELEEDVLAKIPYSREARQGFDPKIHAPITDLHTHSSAQIKSEDLLDLAFEADQKAAVNGEERICYPLGLLDMLGVAPDPSLADERDQQIVDMKGRGFNPMKKENRDWEIENNPCKGVPVSELSSRQCTAIIRKMQVAADQTCAFNDMDPELYRYRNPLVKHDALAKDIIKKIAEDYAAMGIEYAELSTSSMLDPKWFQAMTEALDEIERDGVGPEHKKVKLRFLIGLPRNASVEDSCVWLTKVKHLLRHPYIAGIDLLGYEANKTQDFHWVLSNLFQWASASENTELKSEHGWNFKDWTVYRVHAGENSKVLTNVAEAIHLNHRYDEGRVRIGHAVNYKLQNVHRKELKDLQQEPEKDRIATERCMDANQAYRSTWLVHNQSPTIDAPTFLGSDGGGMLGITPTGLAYSALAAGWSLDRLKQNREWEKRYIERENVRERQHREAFESHYGPGQEGLEKFLNEYKNLDLPIKEKDAKTAEDVKRLPTHFLPKVFEGKKPFLIGGPSGSSWKELDQMDQQTAERAAEFLVRALDPKTTYFVLGRVQKQGVSRALDKAILRYNRENPTNKFAVLGRFHGADKGPAGDLAESLTWVQPIPGDIDIVPSNMIKFIEEKQGKAVIFAGSDFSSGMVGISNDRRVPYAMQRPKKGLFAELAGTVGTQSKFKDFQEFYDHLFIEYGPKHLFRSKEELNHFLRQGIDLDALKQEVRDLRLDSERHVAKHKSSGHWPEDPRAGFFKRG